MNRDIIMNTGCLAIIRKHDSGPGKIIWRLFHFVARFFYIPGRIDHEMLIKMKKAIIMYLGLLLAITASAQQPPHPPLPPHPSGMPPHPPLPPHPHSAYHGHSYAYYHHPYHRHYYHHPHHYYHHHYYHHSSVALPPRPPHPPHP
jgi:hypothetical protein